MKKILFAALLSFCILPIFADPTGTNWTKDSVVLWWILPEPINGDIIKIDGYEFNFPEGDKLCGPKDGSWFALREDVNGDGKWDFLLYEAKK